MKFLTISKLQAGGAILAASLALALAACGGGGSGLANGGNCLGYGGGGGGGGGTPANCNPGNPAPSPTPAPSAAAVGLLLTGENPVVTASDGTVRGFFNGTAHSGSMDSGVVNLTASTNVQFFNVEAAGSPNVHTASNLGPYSGSYPASFTNTNGPTASATGTSIGSANFSSGGINPGAVSRVYTTGGPGMFVFGCYFHYLLDNMRTVVIVT